MVYFDLLIRATRCQVSNTKLDFFTTKGHKITTISDNYIQQRRQHKSTTFAPINSPGRLGDKTTTISDNHIRQ